MGHSQGSHRAARGSRRTGRGPARVPAPPSAPPRSLHEERTIVATLWPGPLPVHDPTVLDTPLVARQAAAPPRETPGHRAARRHRAAPESLRRIVPRALVVAVLAGGTAAFLAQDKAVSVRVDGTSRTLHTFADDVGELLEDEGVTVGTGDTVAPAPATGLDDGDEVVVLREAHGSGPVPGGGPRAPRRP
ncbi:ubiquitin-like domain-containing protein [Streptomyces pratensis]|uniref:ubiquitin-like domain-containing protein n=1 Tax=Streptomyces pratensis TaxID=1169025 RepID=UPI001932E430